MQPAETTASSLRLLRNVTLLLLLSASPVRAGSLEAQPDTLRHQRLHAGTLLAGGSCTEGNCVLQGGFRAAPIGPGITGIDIAFLLGADDLGSVILVDLALTHSGRLAPWLFIAPRLGVSSMGLIPGALKAPWLSLGGGLIAVVWDRLALRADATYRRRLPEIVEGDDLLSLTLGVGLIQ